MSLLSLYWQITASKNELAKKAVYIILKFLSKKFTGNGLRDFWFVLKKKNISVFTSLYESYKTYLVNAENKQQPHPKRGTPESTLFFHFNLTNKKVIECPVMKVDWRHVCNKYCGNKKGKTEILGES